ncbi:hypothetical protein BDW71DRAFT_211089 [Aspergillus fruticulosus]
MVDEHITELRRQLSACKSIFAWIQAWNGYFGRFFVNNFAKPAVCFGREHSDMAISALSHIEHAIFPKCDGGGVTNSLRKTIAERFNFHDIPDGLFYLPIELGGLNFFDPYVPLLAMRARISSKRRTTESKSRPLLRAYQDLIRIPDQISVDLTPAMRGTLTLSATKTSANTISGNWPSMSPYWKWTAELYPAGMVKRYGNLAAMNREFMPVGVVESMKKSKFRWQG